MTSGHQFHVLWQKIEDNQVTVDAVNNVLSAVDNDLWVVAACIDRLVDDVDVQRSLLELGIRRSTSAVDRAKGALPSHSELDSASALGETLGAYFAEVPEDAQLCYMRAVLLHRLDRMSSFVHIYKDVQKEDDIDEEWDDDPWANDTEGPATPKSPVPSGDSLIPLSEFLVKDLVDIACLFASRELYFAVRTLMARHTSTLWPSRFVILKSIPIYALPSEYYDLLPAYDANQDKECTPSPENWRSEQDWVESSVVSITLRGTEALADPAYVYLSVDCSSPTREPLGALELTAWYQDHVADIISLTGMLDIALNTVQHGASLGVPELDKLGEDLSLLTRLVYDSPQPCTPFEAEDWTLSRWQAMEPEQVINAYLAHSTPETVALDISRLILPYLSVLEARAERAGEPDPTLVTRLLYDYILAAPLSIVAAIFEASKPTLPVSQRIIRSDEDVARLALACLYGSDTCDEWPTMGLIFECLPAWGVTDADDDEVDATIVSLGAFVTPTTTRPRCSATDLFLFFKPLPSVSLSRALDILDVHLECGEIFSRWNVPAPLRWFLQSRNDVAEQRAWANKMVRRSSPTEIRSKDDWESLLEDMQKLRTANEAGTQGAFNLLSEEEVSSVFLSGLLSSGLFDIARSLLIRHPSPLLLSAAAVEDACLSASRELYDNASSANYKTGDMKLAYDCLAVPLPSERLQAERDFIKATSILSSFNISSRLGVPLSPIEIRLTKDRLSLIARVLSSTADAYKQTQIILDLLSKLGFKDDIVSEVKTLVMLSDTALQAEDFAHAYETSQKMIETVARLRAEVSMATGTQDGPQLCKAASQVCWVACYQLGRQPEFHATEKKLELLGRALEFCPADKLPDVLASWHRLQRKDLDNRRERLASRSHHRTRPPTPEKFASSLRARLENLHMPVTPLINAEDAAAFAERAFNRIAFNFPFTVGTRGPSRDLTSDEEPTSRDGSRVGYDSEDVSAQASRVLQKGIGWLLGAEDES